MNRFNSTFQVKPVRMKRSQMKRNAELKRVPGTTRMAKPLYGLKPTRETAADRKWKKEVRQRDRFTCRWPGCGIYSLRIHAHHVHTKRQRPDLRYDVDNGAALCSKHHDEIHHTVKGRQRGRELGLLGTETYELARKKSD